MLPEEGDGARIIKMYLYTGNYFVVVFYYIIKNILYEKHHRPETSLLKWNQINGKLRWKKKQCADTT